MKKKLHRLKSFLACILLSASLLTTIPVYAADVSGQSLIENETIASGDTQATGETTASGTSETTAPDTSETTVPETGETETEAQETSASETTSPETSVSETTAPETETTVPETSVPETEETETEETEEIIRDGLVLEDGELYYYTDGVMFCNGYKKIDGNKYYFQSDGKAYHGGLLKYTYNGRTYYSYFQKTEGAFGIAYTNGYISTSTYAVADGNCDVTKCPDGTKRYYYFPTNGCAFTGGFLELINNGKTYYFYFQSNGEGYTKGYLSTHTYAYAGTDKVVHRSQNGDKRLYYFKSNGQALVNSTVEFTSANGKKYCMLCGSNGQGSFFANVNGYGMSGDNKTAKILRNYYQEGEVKGELTKTSAKTDKTTLYYQGDWGTVAGVIDMYNVGCGPAAIAMAVSGYKSGINPAIVATYLYNAGYLYRYGGTTRAGITVGLRHYGFKMLNYITPEGSGGSLYDKAFTLFRKYLDQGRKADMVVIAVPTSKNSLHPTGYWTDNGHYMTITNYRRGSNGVYYYYVNDPSPRKRTGWYTANDLRYYVNVFWIAEYVQ